MHPKTLLFVLLGAVPVVVGGAGVVSVLLLRAGYGFLTWGLLPFLASLLLTVVLGAILGRAAGGTLPGVGRGAGRGDGEEPHGGSPDGQRARGGRNREDR